MTSDKQSNQLTSLSTPSPLGEGRGEGLLGEGRGEGHVIITGASGSVGEAATLMMAQKGWHVIMACRNLEKGEAVRQRVLGKCPSASLDLRELNLESYDSIKAFVDGIHSLPFGGGPGRGAALFNNAGIMCRTFGRTDEGLERTMAVNYLGTKRLTDLLLPLIPAGGHIVNMVSLTARFGKFSEDWRSWDEKDFGQLKTYARSKKGVLLYTMELARKHPELHINVSDPGIVNSNMITMHRWYDPLADIFFRPFIKTPEQGAVPAINALLSELTGYYFVGNKAKKY